MGQIKTAAEYRQMAEDAQRERFESMERCDTDGYLSQWASQEMANHYRYNAKIVEQGYTTELVLMDLEGQILAVEERTGEWGPYFILEDEAAARFGRRFISPSQANDEARRVANNAKKGVKTAWVKTTALYLDRRGILVGDRNAILAGDYTVEEVAA